jgi:glyoxylase I family protein
MKSINHVNIVVQDLEASVAFYRDVLGLEETRRAHLEGNWIEMVTGVKGAIAECVYLEMPSGPRIELLKYTSPESLFVPENKLATTLGIRHIAFEVEDIEATYLKLKSKGVHFINDPVTVPASAVRHTAGEKRLCYFHDPEGVLLELAEFKEW